MKISSAERIPVSKEKILGTDQEFYNYFKHVIRRINTTFSRIEGVINYPRAVARLSRTANLDTSTNGGADTWITIPFESKEKFSGEIKLGDDGEIITVRNEGHYLTCFNVMFVNNRGSSVNAPIFLRILLNDVEVPNSTAVTNMTKEDGEFITFGGFSTILRASSGDTLKFQYRVGHEDIDIESHNTFDDPRSVTASILQMEA